LTKDERHCSKRCVVSKIGKGRGEKEGELASRGRLLYSTQRHVRTRPDALDEIDSERLLKVIENCSHW